MSARLVALPSPFGSTQLDYGAGRVRWWSFRETTGTTPAVFDLYDGSVGSLTQPLITLSLGPGESTRDFVGHHLIPYYVGLYLSVTSGTVLGAIQLDDLDDYGSAMPVVVVGSINISEVKS